MDEKELQFWIQKGFFVSFRLSSFQEKPILVPLVSVGMSDSFPIPIIRIVYPLI